MVSPASAFAVDFSKSRSNKDQIDNRFKKEKKEVRDLAVRIGGRKIWNSPL